VAAVNHVGTGAFTAATVAVVPATFADVPTALVATRGNGQVSLSWKAPASNGGLAITDHVVQSSTDGGRTWKAFPHKASAATTIPVTGLANGTSYVFRVASVNGVGTGPYTNQTAAVVPATVAGVPTGLTATRGDRQVSLTWKAPTSNGGSAITDYVVQSSTDGGKNWKAVAHATSVSTALTVTGLVNGTSYVFRVATVNDVGTGAFTAATTAVVPATNPGEPTQMTVTRSGTKVTLTWKAPAFTGGAGITDYVVEWSGDNGSTWNKLERTPSTATTATVTGLTATQMYRFRVATKNAAGFLSTFVMVVSNGAAA
jgi:predicted phage tail protein